MKLELTHYDLNQAIRNYLTAQGINTVDKRIDTQIITKRKTGEHTVLVSLIHDSGMIPPQLELDLQDIAGSESEPVIPEKFQGLDL
jgi:hypothetical protein